MTGGWPPTSISVLAPVEAGRELALQAHVKNLPLPPAGQSPFARLDSVHMARLVVVGQVKQYRGIPRAKRPLRLRYLLFSVVANRPAEAFFEDLHRMCGPEADGIWGSCLGYPGSEDRDGFLAYMQRNLLPAHQTYAAFDATVPQINAALEIRRWHAQFAIRAQGLDPADLLREFLLREGGA